jgi:DNA-binding transcriptional MerR regulator
MTDHTNAVYSAADLQEKLHRIRGKPVPLPTLKYWRQRLGITPDRNRLYTHQELDVLRGLVMALNRGKTIEQYKRFLKERLTRGNESR